MYRVWGKVGDLVNGRPYVGGLRIGLLNFSPPLVKLYFSRDCIVLQPRFGLGWLWRAWVIDRGEVAYIAAPGRGFGVMERVSIALEPRGLFVFWTVSATEIFDRLRDLGYPCSSHEGPGNLH